ncbi:trypsin-like peptidase domain-containing protein [Streptosporangium saharense]|uniref:trypsin-like peptidase domain-containing protein n=1 Tax=Streptosporangium saharense TaxID=1706840 RepID=UPI001C87CABC|nr:trypsin-like peptidase domain-containing protein [Streptosporangium saharense]
MLTTWRARITGKGERSPVTGAGVLVDARHLLTCAHVVHGCSDLTVSFVQAGRGDLQNIPVDVSHLGPWRSPGDPGDIAVLELPDKVDLSPARFSLRPDITAELNAHGFPKDAGPFGSALGLRVTSSHGIGEWLSIEATTGHAEFPRKGFSGSGVYEENSGEVLGLVSDASPEASRRTGRMIPVETIRRHWEDFDDLLDLPWLPREARIRLRAIVGAAVPETGLAELVAGVFPGTPRPRDLHSPWDAVRFVAEELRVELPLDDRLTRIVTALSTRLTGPGVRTGLAEWLGTTRSAPPASAFFLSHCEEDAAYAGRLGEHLRLHGVPVSHDGISRALGVIVLVSPEAERSGRVIGEVLEGQRHNRRIIPVLLRGEPLSILGSTRHFDARDGALPDEEYLREPPQAPRPLPRPPIRSTPATGTAPIRKLTSLLDDRALEHADLWTTTLLLDTAGRLGTGWMRRLDGELLPYGLLEEVDAVWARALDGTQGFGTQLACYDGPPPGTPAGHAGDFFALADALGWRRDRQATPRYGEFVPAGPLPTGFFPTLRNPQLEHHRGWHDQWRQTAMAVHLRLRKNPRMGTRGGRR